MEVTINQEKYPVKMLISKEEIESRVQTLAQEINQYYQKNETIVALIVLHGAIVFASDLMRHLHMPIVIETTRLRSYHGVNQTSTLEHPIPIPHSVEGKKVLLIEDIVDSGKSLKYLIPKILEKGAIDVKIVVLLDKPKAHQVEITPDFVGFEIGNEFVIGYGLDLYGVYRNLPYIGQVIIS